MGWIELVFIAGRVKHLGGEFSIMFYNIVTKVGGYFLIICVMVVGFSMAFMVIHHDLDSTEEVRICYNHNRKDH